jgi:hypothetical protein
MRGLAWLLVLALSSALDVAPGARGRADDVGEKGGLQILFPRPDQTLCHEDELELLALYNGSPLVPAGSVAVLELHGRAVSELHSGALSARLPVLHGA